MAQQRALARRALEQMREARELGLDARSRTRIVSEQPEVGELEAGGDRAAHQREVPGRPRRLPAPGGHREGSRVPFARRAQADLSDAERFGVDAHERERIALVEGPELVRRHRVPTADLTGREQEEDRGQRGTLGSSVVWTHPRLRTEVLAEEAALRVRLERE